MFGPKRDENGEWRKLHNEEFNSSPSIVRMIKSVRLRRPRNVVRMKEDRSAFKILTGKPSDSLLTNQNSILEEIKCRIKAGNSCYYSVKTVLSSRLRKEFEN